MYRKMTCNVLMGTLNCAHLLEHHKLRDGPQREKKIGHPTNVCLYHLTRWPTGI